VGGGRAGGGGGAAVDAPARPRALWPVPDLNESCVGHPLASGWKNKDFSIVHLNM
jgi:hypothetical protein